MIDTVKLLAILAQGGLYIAAFAAIAAGVIMSTVTKKFGTGILAVSFKAISLGVFFIAAGIVIDAIGTYFQTSESLVTWSILILKELFFITGTYIIVIGSKKAGDKLESLTK